MYTIFWTPYIVREHFPAFTLSERGTLEKFDQLLKKGTRLFSISFFISAILNFLLALQVFTHIDPALPDAERTQRLNEQIAHMSLMSLAMIALPLLCFTALFLFWFFRQLKELSGLKLDQLTVD